ncbi:uncharacterized protein LOC113235290 [Hyposmocoma kahamanoa]|uniref:uncharacterized protein LOC113235290 n=1 Tax=Hyposmocoma kahamanoa TaxID=1477025 RepID=UPI000E6D9B56|nr:uncharacterized protein LOC113235290 [Hyposmocoma kahamanoa]
MQVSGTICVLLTLVAVVTVKNIRDRFYPRYHLAAPRGWMGKPNGFVMFRGIHHLFYQFNPNSTRASGALYWGHAKSVNLFHWEHEPIALYPDKWLDKSGAMAGTAIVEDDTILILYTGRINHPGEDPDHEEHICFANQYGKQYYKHSLPVIEGNEHQPNFRDPYFWKYNNMSYALIGSSFLNNTKCRILLYQSQDRIHWSQISVLYQSDEILGNMCESPNLFALDDYYVLLFSVPGIKPDGIYYQNSYESVYVIGDFNYKSYTFVPLTSVHELDHGHDFYGPQTFIDDIGRRILIAWFSVGTRDYPENEDGFAGCMTMPRELAFGRNHELIQKPLAHSEHARGPVVRRGLGRSNDSVILPDRTGEIIIKSNSKRDVQVYIESNKNGIVITYNAKRKLITLDRGGLDGIRRANWNPGRRLRWIIYIDASTVELFCGNGEVTFTSRFFPSGTVTVRLGELTQVHVFKVSEMQRTIHNITSARKKGFLFMKAH